MKLKKLKIENIRSYEDLEVNFPDGSVLLSGDIGSGKTSVLLAIEFALFGLQPGQKGASLLRHGKDTASVVLELELSGKNIVIERGLKRGKSINQSTGSVEIDGIKKEMSVIELKNSILKLLNYPPEFAKKTNLLYKFTVYTPQEEMKHIIIEDAETRLDTLRHIFDIDRYKRVKENCSMLITKIREEIRSSEPLFLDMQEKKSQKEQHELLKKETESKLVLFDKKINQIKMQKQYAENDLKKIEEKIKEKIQIDMEIEKLKLFSRTRQENIERNIREIINIEHQIKDLKDISFNQLALETTEKELKHIKEKSEKIEARVLRISSQISALKLRNQEANSIIFRLKNLKLCPTCLQDVNETHKSTIQLKYEQEEAENNKKIELEEEKLKHEKQEKTILLNEIDKLEKTRQELNFLKIRLETINEKKNKIEMLEKENEKTNLEKNGIKENIVKYEKSIAELEKYDSLFNEKKLNLNEISAEEKSYEIKFAEMNKEKQFLQSQIIQLEKEIAEKEKLKEKTDYLKELESWLGDSFIPLISFTEKNVMLKLREEFSKLFSEWFSILVSDSLNVRIDENFTPLIEQQGYELDYSFLSGGERTAVALAYRLSLNQVINSLLSKIKTNDLIILDEPTDGFSEQQLDKMRDVLQQLNVKQLILVSHEQKIEGFVENIIRFKKDAGISRIEK